MADHKFTFEDGTTVEFDKFDHTQPRDRRAYCGQPAKAPGNYTGTIAVLLPLEAYTYYNQNYHRHLNSQDKKSKYNTCIIVGLLEQKMDVGIPRGTYVPLRWNGPMQRFDIFLIGLENDGLILDERIANEDVIEAVKKAELIEVD